MISKIVTNVNDFLRFFNPDSSSVTKKLAFKKPVSFNKRYNNINFNPSLAEDDDVRTELFKCSLFASEEKDAWLQWTS